MKSTYHNHKVGLIFLDSKCTLYTLFLSVFPIRSIGLIEHPFRKQIHQILFRPKAGMLMLGNVLYS